MIEIKEVISEKEKKSFVKFPFKLYKNSPYWVPPIISEELKVFDKSVFLFFFANNKSLRILNKKGTLF